MHRNPNKLAISVLPSYLQDLNEKARPSPIRLSSESDESFSVYTPPSRWKTCLLITLSLLSGAAIVTSIGRCVAIRTSSLPPRYSKAPSLVDRGHALVPVRTASQQEYWRDNLLPDLNYITGGPFGGTSNQFHGLTNLLYLASLTKRVAIIPALEPGWVKPAVWARVSDFWDLERFQRETGIPLLELSDIRANQSSPTPPKQDRLACWSSTEVIGHARGPLTTTWYHELPFNNWPMPPSITVQPEWNREMPFEVLRMFDLQKSARDEWLAELRSERAEAEKRLLKGRQLAPVGAKEPDDQLLCFDDFFYMHSAKAASHAFEPDRFGRERASWEAVGQHLHWNAHVDAAADEILSHVFGSTTKPYIAIHMRRNDFGKGRTVQSYKRALDSLYKQMQQPAFAQSAGPLPANFDPRKLPVFLLTDETDAAFRATIEEEMGWKTYDHEVHGTAERLGPWWPSIIDSALLSRSHGIVGTAGSTYSFQSVLRAQAWQGAAVTWV